MFTYLFLTANTEQADNDAFIALVTEAKYVEIQEIENADKNEKKIVEVLSQCFIIFVTMHSKN